MARRLPHLADRFRPAAFFRLTPVQLPTPVRLSLSRLNLIRAKRLRVLADRMHNVLLFDGFL